MPALLFMRFEMLFRTLFNFVFASPVTIVTTVVSVACAGVLVVKVSSYIEATSDSEDVSVNVTKHVPASSSSNRTDSQKIDANRPVSNRQTDFEQDDDATPAYQQRNLSSGNNRTTQKKNYTNKNRNTDTNQNDNNTNEQHFLDETEGLLTGSDRPTSNNNGPSIFNYSNVGGSSSATTSSPASSSPSSSTTVTESNTGASDSETPSPTDDPESDPVDKPEDDPEEKPKCDEFPASLEYEIPITADRTDSVSCVPIVANGRPCMCTHTIVDGDDITSWVEDNCGIVEDNSNLLCN